MASENPWGREYTPEEWAAARRVGLQGVDGGPLIWGSPRNPSIPEEASKALKRAADWQTVLTAWEREKTKERSDD